MLAEQVRHSARPLSLTTPMSPALRAQVIAWAVEDNDRELLESLTDDPDVLWEAAMTDTDLVPVDSLDAVDRAYVKASERAAGTVSRRLVEQRRRAAEGHALQRMREGGENLAIREVLHRPGQPAVMTTSVRTRVDLDEDADQPTTAGSR